MSLNDLIVDAIQRVPIANMHSLVFMWFSGQWNDTFGRCRLCGEELTMKELGLHISVHGYDKDDEWENLYTVIRKTEE